MVTSKGDNILHEGRLGSYSGDAFMYTSSIDIDGRLLSSVIKINSAHLVMLSDQAIIEKKTAAELLYALSCVPSNLEMKDDLEDVHMNVENFVISKIGLDSGGMMNLAKSRNDQVATALRMVLRDELISIGEAMVSLEKSLIEQSKKHFDTFLAGYTHLQRGQPVTLGHHLLAHFDSLDRDFSRLVDCYLRVDLSPMGAGALATTGFSINRQRVADLLGFESVLENSLDAVSSRDFATEAIYLCAQAMTDLSRLAEELILWSTKEFSFAEMPDEYSSTSSMMPQKKNAIVPEIFRAKTSQVLGDLVGAMGIVRSLPQSYNLDLQELTRNLWSSTEKAWTSISILSNVVKETKFNSENMSRSVTSDEFLFATELADYLVKKFGLSFREAHARVGRLVKFSSEGDRTASQLTGLDSSTLSNTLGVEISPQDLSSIFDPKIVLSKRSATGSPNPKMVLSACRAREKITEKHEATLSSFKHSLERSNRELEQAAATIRRSVVEPHVERKTNSKIGKKEVKE